MAKKWESLGRKGEKGRKGRTNDQKMKTCMLESGNILPKRGNTHITKWESLGRKEVEEDEKGEHTYKKGGTNGELKGPKIRSQYVYMAYRS